MNDDERDIQEFEQWYQSKFDNLLRDDLYAKLLHHNAMLQSWIEARRTLREKPFRVTCHNCLKITVVDLLKGGHQWIRRKINFKNITKIVNTV